ncbi:TonB-dependent receptor [Bryobacter aggregatus]|uniref:TonB-dependent receptor n=1 Tax=Bryobacter aggregatus TaxID=360054 RepID=UPI0004E0BADB|nr:TonB-dependent receptor [Bryobacter aggregatus]
MFENTIRSTVALLLLSLSSFAQETRGTIVGRVTDASAATVAGAQVTVIHREMGTKQALKTNGEGIYQAALLLPGFYRIEVEAPGFKRFVRDNVEVRINDRIEVNGSLEVGGGAETVTINSETPPLTTESGSMGQVIDSRRVADLPLSYGNPFQLIGLSAGVSFARDPRLDRPFEPTHIVGYAMNGTRANRSDVTLDGVPSTATANPGEVTATYVPPTDIVAEFKVQTSTYDASLGNTEGGVTNISIKSGTNSFHGTAYYSVTRPNLWGNDYFANATGKARADFIFNRWGGSIGGPVRIPKLYNGKNKTFFLWGYEAIRDSRPRNDGTPTVPTPAMKGGDFSQLLALNSSYQIYNPFTRRAVAGGRIQSDPFPGNIVPASLISPIAKNILSYFANPVSAGNADGSSNFQQPYLTEDADYFTHTARVDHMISDRQRLYVRGSYYDRNSTYNNFFNNLSTGTVFKFLSRGGVIDDTITINPTTVLDLRYGYNRFIRITQGNPLAAGFDLTSLGFPAYLNNAVSASVRQFPRIDLTGYQGTAIGAENRPIDSHSINITLNKMAGAHALKGGMEWRAYRENSFPYGNDQTSRFNFDASFTKGPLDNSATAPGSLGQSVASLLLGLPSSSNSYLNRPADYAEQSMTYGFFVHDDWKLNRKLTLNIGLRYEFETALTERYNRSVQGFDGGYVPPFAAQALANYAASPSPLLPANQFRVAGGLTFAGINGNSRGTYNPPHKNLLPRFGLAYQLDKGTVIRAGYGMFLGFLGERRGDVIQSGFSRQTPFIPTIDNINFSSTLANPFPNGILEPLGAAQGSLTFMGQGISYFNQYPLQSRMQRWSLSIQRELKGGMVFEASYTGNKGTRIEMTRNLNATPRQYLGTSPFRDQDAINRLSANVNNPFVNLLPAGATSTFTGTTIPVERLLRPYPQFDSVTSTTYDGYSWYHGLQLHLERRFSKGYTILGNYTFSKFMQATELLNPSDIAPTRSISDQDFPHRFSVSGIAELPFGHGRALLANSNKVVNALVGGWQISGIYTFQSGAPINWNLSNAGNYNLSTSAISFFGNPNDIRLSDDAKSLNKWFNPNAGFVTAAAAQIDVGRQLRSFPLRFGSIRADKINNIDTALVKNTRLWEGKSLQFRAEGLNTFNHPYFPAPVTNPTAANFGQVTASNQANYPRRLQLTLKFLF